MNTPSDPSTPKMSPGRILGLACRFVAGYILAVAAGTAILSITAKLISTIPLLQGEEAGILDPIGKSATVVFIFGIVLAIPYTVVGSILFWCATQRRTAPFLLIGTFCPAASILLFLSMFGIIGMTWPLFKLLLATLPAGLAAAYVYGAIGFGQGFGRWRFE
jgi:hypothetical protein